MKKLSVINEISVNNNQSTQQALAIDNELENGLKLAIQNLPQQMPFITNQILKAKETQTQTITGEENKINEIGIGINIGTTLTAPKITELLNRSVRQLGFKTDVNLIRNFGQKLSILGQKWHLLYLKPIERAIIPFTKNLSPENKKIWSENILLSFIVGIGIISAQRAIMSAQQGSVGSSTLENTLGNIRANEIATMFKDILPRIIGAISNEVTTV